ncbi:MAG: hypothetical protein WBV82_24560 [Myxococcaceae bacterium]
MHTVEPKQRVVERQVTLVRATVVAVLLLGLASTEAQAEPAQALPPPAPYSLPFQLRPAMAVSAARLDSALALWQGAAGLPGTTVVSTALFSYKLAPGFSPLLRLGIVGNAPPGPAEGNTRGAASFMNPVLGATYGFSPHPQWKVALFLGAAFPLGTGSTASPERVANAAGVLGRSAMDNAMFAVNYLTFFPGVGVAWVANGWTVQLEATLLQLLRVRGEEVDSDAARTNFTSGLHVGYFFIPQLSLGAELRYQRWLSNPSVPADAPAVDTLTAAIGPRVHFKLTPNLWSRAAVVYSRGLDNPMAAANYHVVQLDLAFPF